MIRRMIGIVLVCAALVFVASIISARYHVPSSAAYAQGAFGRKQTGSADPSAQDQQRKAEEVRRAEESRKAEEARRADEQRRQEEARKAEQRRREDEDRRRLEEARRQEELRPKAGYQKVEQSARDDEAKRQEEARRQEELRRQEETRRQEEARKQEQQRLEEERRRNEAAGRPERPDAIRPTEERRHEGGHKYPGGQKPGSPKKYDRVNERPDYRREQPTIVVVPAPPPVIIVETPPPVVIYEPVPVYIPLPAEPEARIPEIELPAPVPEIPRNIEPDPELDLQPVPVPSTADDAVAQIKRAWTEQRVKLLSPMLPEDEIVVVRTAARKEHSMSGSDFYSLTAEAIGDTETIDIRLDVTEESEDRVIAEGYHVYRTSTGTASRNIWYIISFQEGAWVITEAGVGDRKPKPRPLTPEQLKAMQDILLSVLHGAIDSVRM